MIPGDVHFGWSNYQRTCHGEGKRLENNRGESDSSNDLTRKVTLRDGNQKPQHCQNRERDEHDAVGVDALVAVAVAAIATDDEPRTAKSES